MGSKEVSSATLAFSASKKITIFLLTLLAIISINSVSAFELAITAPTTNQNISGTFLLQATTGGEFANVTNVTFWFFNSTGYFNITSANPNVTKNNESYGQTAWNYSLTTTNMADDVYTFGVFAINATGDGNGTDYTINVTNVKVDNTPPTITIVSPANTTYELGTSVVINYSASETVDLNTDAYELDGGANTSFVNGTDAISPGVGGHSLRVWANDSNGNRGTGIIYFTVVDTTPPSAGATMAVNSTHVYGTWLACDAHDINITASFNDTVSGINTSSCEWQDRSWYSQPDKDTNGWRNDAGIHWEGNSTDGCCIATTATSTAEQEYNLRLRVKDNAGNLAVAPYFFGNTDCTSSSTTDDETGGWHNANYVITLTPSDSKSGVKYTNYSINGASNQTGTSVSVTNEANNTVVYYSVDNVGNVESTKTTYAALDKTNPSVALTAPSTVEKGDAAGLMINITELQPDTYLVFKNGTPVVNGSFANMVAFNVSIDTSMHGDLNYTVLANDTVGNVSRSEVLVAVRDTTPPSISISTPSNSRAQVLSSANLTITIYDLQPGDKKIFLNGSLVAGPADYSGVNGVAFNFSINTSAAGTLDYTVWANDSVGNANQVSVLVEVTSFEADPPVISITNPANGSTIGVLNNTVVGSVSDESSLKNVTLYLNGVVESSWTTAGSFNRIVDYNPGATNTIKIVAEDVHGNNVSVEIAVFVAQTVAEVITSVTGNQTTIINETITNTSTSIEFVSTVNGTVTVTVNASLNATELATQLNASAVDFTAYAAAQAYSSIDKSIMINVSGAINESANLSWVNIRVYYSDADLDRNGDGDASDPGDINPTSLKLWRYCPVENKWDVVDKGQGQIKCGTDTIDIFDSGVNTTGKFVFANLSRFSVYGLAGTVTPAPTPSGGAGGRLATRAVVLANSIDRALAADFYGFLRNQGIEIVEATAANFTQYKSYKHIIILGGPDAPEGIGEIVRDLLSEDEETFLRTRGNRKMYVKTSIWTTGQVVRIIAGSGRTLTQEEWKANKEDVGNNIKKFPVGT